MWFVKRKTQNGCYRERSETMCHRGCGGSQTLKRDHNISEHDSKPSWGKLFTSKGKRCYGRDQWVAVSRIPVFLANSNANSKIDTEEMGHFWGNYSSQSAVSNQLVITLNGFSIAAGMGRGKSKLCPPLGNCHHVKSFMIMDRWPKAKERRYKTVQNNTIHPTSYLRIRELSHQGSWGRKITHSSPTWAT